jgi:hypothetical protein
MNRASFIKNTLGVIIGYALLPKNLPQVKAKQPLEALSYLPGELVSGVGSTTFKIKLNKDWFAKGDILQTLEGQAFLEEETKTGFKGRFLLSGGPADGVKYHTLEIVHDDNCGISKQLLDPFMILDKPQAEFKWHYEKSTYTKIAE